eukprot:CAMPEP_0114535064 /NCGR_PEP_ID=MMETSP0109-20121206/28210_1 /TAXON_ID=29199 /ORGANISM="Chlorarachnion reptans, Strain CCCM449" /LENGTH=2382 /DNA_ID=CAMNT_0001718591 /DNA_START=65 /DNA_END=7213 /DNA_ORIENTATION=-
MDSSKEAGMTDNAQQGQPGASGIEMEGKATPGVETRDPVGELQGASQLTGSRQETRDRDTDSIIAVASTERLMESWVLREGISSAVREGVLREGLSESHRDMIGHLVRQIEELKAKSETSRMNSELLHEQQEKKYQNAVDEIRILREQRGSAEKKYQDLKQNVSVFTGNAGKLKEALQKQQSTNTELSKERSELLAANAKQHTDLEDLMGQLRQYSNKSMSMNSQVCDLQAKLGEVETEKVRLEMEKAQLETRLKLAEGNAKWSQDELEKKRQQLESLRSEMDTEVVIVRSEAERSKSELKLLHEQLNASRKQAQSLSGKLEESTGKMREMEAKYNQDTRDLEASLQTQTALTKSYNETVDRAKKRTQRSEQEVQILREALAKQRDEAKAKEQSFQSKINELEESLRKSTKDLQEAKSGLDQKGAMVVASNFAEGTETEKQVKMVEMFNVNQKLKVENSRLSRYLKTIQREVARKEPLMKEQEAKYYRLCSANKDLGDKLQNALLENDRYKTFNTRLREKVGALTKERKELQMRVKVVTQQNIDLMEEQESKRPSGIIRENAPHGGMDIITQKLIHFKSVPELYAQYQRLFMVCQQFKQRCERYEKQLNLAEKFKEKASKTEDLMLLVKNFRTQNLALRDENLGLKSQIQKFRQVGQLAGHSIEDTKNPERSIIPTKHGDSSFKELVELHERYKKEKTLTEKQLHEDNNKIRSELSEVKFKLTKAEMEVKYATVQQKRDSEALAGYRKEIDTLRKQCSEYSNSMIEHQSKIQELMKDLRAEKAKYQEEQSKLNRTKSELRTVKQSQESLSHKYASLMVEKKRSVALMATLDSIQTSLRKKDEESQRGVIQEKREIHAELEAIKKKLAQAQLEADGKLRAKELECEAMRKKADAHSKQASVHESKFHTADKIRIELSHKLEKIEAKVPELEKQLEAAKKDAENERELRKRMLQGDPESKRRHQLEEEVKSLTEENKLLSTSVTESAKHVEKFKQLATDCERALREHTESRAEERASLKKQIEESNGQREVLAKRVEEFVKHCRTSDREVETLKEKLAEVEKTSKNEIAEAQRVKSFAEKTLESAKVDIKKFQDEAAKFSEVAKEANERYERELFLHVEKAKEVQEVKKREEKTLELKAAAEALAKSWEEKAALARSEVSQAEAAVQAERDGAEAKIAIMRRENELLQSQMESLAAQVQILKNSAEPNALFLSAGSNDVEENTAAEQERAIRELRELQSMAAKEKEQLELKLTRALQTAARAEALLGNERRALKDTREELARVSASQNNRDNFNAEEYAMLEQKIHDMRLLKESNETLREQGERDKKRADSAEKRLSELETKTMPLQKESLMLQAKIEFLESEKRSLLQENETWKQRNMKLLDKYQMVDAQVHADLKLEYEKEKARVEEQSKKLETLTTVQKELGEMKTKHEDVKQQLSTKTKELEKKTKAHADMLGKAKGWKKGYQTAMKKLEAQKKIAAQLRKSSGAGGKKVKELETRCATLSEFGTKAKKILDAAHVQHKKKIEELNQKLKDEVKLKTVLAKKASQEKERIVRLLNSKLKQEQQKVSQSNQKLQQLKSGYDKKLQEYQKKIKLKEQHQKSYLAELVKLREEQRMQKRRASMPEPSANTSASQNAKSIGKPSKPKSKPEKRRMPALPAPSVTDATSSSAVTPSQESTPSQLSNKTPATTSTIRPQIIPQTPSEKRSTSSKSNVGKRKSKRPRPTETLKEGSKSTGVVPKVSTSSKETKDAVVSSAPATANKDTKSSSVRPPAIASTTPKVTIATSKTNAEERKVKRSRVVIDRSPTLAALGSGKPAAAASVSATVPRKRVRVDSSTGAAGKRLKSKKSIVAADVDMTGSTMNTELPEGTASDTKSKAQKPKAGEMAEKKTVIEGQKGKGSVEKMPIQVKDVQVDENTTSNVDGEGEDLVDKGDQKKQDEAEKAPMSEDTVPPASETAAVPAAANLASSTLIAPENVAGSQPTKSTTPSPAADSAPVATVVPAAATSETTPESTVAAPARVAAEAPTSDKKAALPDAKVAAPPTETSVPAQAAAPSPAESSAPEKVKLPVDTTATPAENVPTPAQARAPDPKIAKAAIAKPEDSEVDSAPIADDQKNEEDPSTVAPETVTEEVGGVETATGEKLPESANAEAEEEEGEIDEDIGDEGENIEFEGDGAEGAEDEGGAEVEDGADGGEDEGGEDEGGEDDAEEEGAEEEGAEAAEIDGEEGADNDGLGGGDANNLGVQAGDADNAIDVDIDNDEEFDDDDAAEEGDVDAPEAASSSHGESAGPDSSIQADAPMEIKEGSAGAENDEPDMAVENVDRNDAVEDMEDPNPEEIEMGDPSEGLEIEKTGEDVEVEDGDDIEMQAGEEDENGIEDAAVE